MRLVTWIQIGLLLLVAVMPFHAFLSVWLGHLIGYQAIWQSWKEVLLLGLIALCGVLLYQEPKRLIRLRTWFNYWFLGFIMVALIVTAFNHGSFSSIVFGIKTDVEFLVAFVIAQLVSDKSLLKRLVRTILISSGIVIAFGLLQIFALPSDFLRHFGYGPQTIEPFFMVDPAINDVRILSTLGGPNQLGSFLILPLALIVWQLLQKPRLLHVLYLVAGLVVLWHTYGRGAQIALAVACFTLILLRLPRRWRLWSLLAAVALAALALNLLIANISSSRTLQYYIFHQTIQETGIPASTDQHLSALQHGASSVANHPWGQGLGSAGPASFKSDEPFIPESYYLQLGVEAGVLGCLLFILGCAFLGWRLWAIGDAVASGALRRQAALAAVAALAGISVLNLVLHGWTDSSTALIFWSFTGAVVASKA